MERFEQLVKALRRCASIDRCDGMCEMNYGSTGCESSLEMDAADAIDALQAETVRLWPKRGKWINSKERMRPDMCSVCGCVYEADRFMDKIAWNYCPKCGAKMEVQE